MYLMPDQARYSSRHGIRAMLAAGLFILAALPSASPAQDRIRYADIAPDTKFSYITNNDLSPRKYFPQPMCGGVAIFDYDRDGWMDIYFTNGARLPELSKSGAAFHHCLLRNKGSGRFEEITESAGLTAAHLGYSFGVAAGDYDNDGFPDLFIANAGPNALFRNDGDGAFTDVTAESGLTKPDGTLSVQGAWLDYDNDGWLDLVVSNYTRWTPAEDIPCVLHDGQAFYCNPRIYPAVPHRLYRNLGDGSFADVTEESGFRGAAGKGMGIAIADFNRDGWPDIFIANDTEPNFLFLNQRDGSFQESALEHGVAYHVEFATPSNMGADARDYDNDGWADLFYSNLTHQLHALFRNRGGQDFEYASPSTGVESLSRTYSGWSNAFIDFDNDGWKDIYSANGHIDNIGRTPKQHDTMLRNLGGSKFHDVSRRLGKGFLRRGYQRGSAVGDLNNDGFLDIVVTSLNERPRILINSGGNGNDWLLLALEGTRSNRSAIGAAVKVITESGAARYNHVSPSAGFLSSSDPRLHFGFSKEDGPVSIEIRWPSGQIQRLTDVPVDQLLTVREPIGAAQLKWRRD